MRYSSLYLLVTFQLLALTACAPNLSPVTSVIGPVEHTLSGAEPQTHQIELAADQYFLVEVEQLGIDASVEVQNPAGQSIARVNAPTERVGKETVLLKTRQAGAYQVIVRSNEYAKKKGQYRFTVNQLSSKTRSDRRRLEAETALTDAAQMNFEIADSSDSTVIETLRADAIEQYEIARAEWYSLRNTNEEAWALYAMAAQYYQLFEWELAAEFAANAALISSKSKQQEWLAYALQLQGMALIETYATEDFESALKKFASALQLQQVNGNIFDQANIINNIGLAYFQQGELSQARTQFVKANAMFKELGELQHAMLLLNNIAATDQMLGNYPAALETYKKALDLSARERFDQDKAIVLDNLAVVYAILNNLQKALLTYREASEAYKDLGDRLGTARALSGTGFTYGRMGNWQAALTFFEQALALQQGPAENATLVRTQIDIGNAYRELNKPAKALEAHGDALKIAKLPEEIANTHIELGRDYAALGDQLKAIEHLDKALESATGDGVARSRAFALQARGQIKLNNDSDVSAGLADLRQALQQHRSLRSDAGEAQTLQALARAEHKLGRVNRAIEYAEEALTITEMLRKRVGSPDLRLSFTGLQLPTYELHIELLMELADSSQPKPEDVPNYAALALEVSERARARSLVELLTEAHTEESQGIDTRLLHERDQKRQQLAGLVYRLETLAAEGDTTEGLQKTLQSVQTDLDVIDARIRSQNSQFAELTEPPVLNVADIQALLAPTATDRIDTVLLEYSLGEKQSFVWCVSENTVASWKLPGRASIEQAARAVYEKFKTFDMDRTARMSAQRAAIKLTDMVLAPVAECIAGKRVVLVPDGALQYIPFAALPLGESASHRALMLELHEIVTLPSASTLAVLRENRQHREPDKAIAIFADPVFSLEDARVTKSEEILHSSLSRSGEARGRDLSRLPASGREADAIAALAPADSVLEATGFAASRSNVINSPLDNYRRIHFATHGLINSKYPELSSLALSSFTQTGEPQPGFLRLHDIYGLKLNADLVVLSACEAALGKDIRGEGLIGLTRGFMYAGSPRVVASLWRASDEATAALMQEFYRLMLKQELRAADALRKAQLTISRQRKWRDPYYWAGFVLQGDWR